MGETFGSLRDFPATSVERGPLPPAARAFNRARHLIGAMSQDGKVGLTALANSPEQANELYESTLTVLDAAKDYSPGRARRVDRDPIS